MTEAELGKRLGEVLKNIHIPDEALAQIEKRMSKGHASSETAKKEQRHKLEQRLSAVRQRIDNAYMDKLDGKISEDFWQRKNAEWQQQEQQILFCLAGLGTGQPGYAFVREKDFRTRQSSLFLYLTPASRTRPITQKSTFELPCRWRKSLSCI